MPPAMGVLVPRRRPGRRRCISRRWRCCCTLGGPNRAPTSTEVEGGRWIGSRRVAFCRQRVHGARGGSYTRVPQAGTKNKAGGLTSEREKEEKKKAKAKKDDGRKEREQPAHDTSGAATAALGPDMQEAAVATPAGGGGRWVHIGT